MIDKIILPEGAIPSYGKTFPMINPCEKYKNGKKLNFKESSDFSGICSISSNQIIDCYYVLDKEITPYEFQERCFDCPYALNHSRFCPNFTNRNYNFLYHNFTDEIEFDNPKAYIYFISDGEFVKIGVAKNALKRLSELQVSNARELKILFCIPATNEKAAFKIENFLHKEYKNLRIRGEWYNLLNYLFVDEWKDFFEK